MATLIIVFIIMAVIFIGAMVGILISTAPKKSNTRTAPEPEEDDETMILPATTPTRPSRTPRPVRTTPIPTPTTPPTTTHTRAPMSQSIRWLSILIIAMAIGGYVIWALCFGLSSFASQVPIDWLKVAFVGVGCFCAAIFLSLAIANRHDKKKMGIYLCIMTLAIVSIVIWLIL